MPVNIHGKEYLTVAERINTFRTDDASKNFAITTELVGNDNEYVVMKTTIADEKGRVIATGHAQEKYGSSNINSTSALENCETSAIGRALATFGLGGTEFASADEVATAIKQQAEGVSYSPNAGKGASEKQIGYIKKMFADLAPDDDFSFWYQGEYNESDKDMSSARASEVIARLQEGKI